MTAPEWRDCADPDELAAAVAAGVEVLRMRGGGWVPSALTHRDDFAWFLTHGTRYQLPAWWTWRPEPPAPDDGPLGIYVASRTIHAAMWKELRSEGVPIISTWLDEAGAGETEDFSDLWRRCVDEVKRAGRLVAFHSEGDVWKGAFIEIGVALGAGVPVTVVGGPPGSWLAHPLVSQARSVREAVGLASPGEPPEPPATDNLAARARRHADTHPESRDLIEELLGAVEMLRHYDVTCEDGGTFIPVVVVWDPHVPGLVVTRDIRESWKQRGPAQPVAPDGTVEVLKATP